MTIEKRATVRIYLATLLSGVLLISACSNDPETTEPTTPPVTGEGQSKTDEDSENSGSDNEESKDDSAAGDSAGPTPTTPDESDPDEIIQVSTTADKEIKTIVDTAGEEFVEDVLLNELDETYGDLAAKLETDDLLTDELAEKWRQQANETVKGIDPSAKIVRQWAVRVEETDATYQIAYQEEDKDEETVIFLEFVLEDDSWKITEII